MKKILILLIVINIFHGCSNDENTPIKPEVQSYDITTENTNVKSYQVVTLSLSDVKLIDSYDGMFGNSSVKIVKTGEDKLSFAIPNIENGSYDLDFDLGTVKFNVVKTVVSSAEQVLANVFQNFNTDISNLENTDVFIASEIENAQNYYSEIQELYNSLSAEEKQEVALFYTANKNVFKAFKDNLYTNLDAPTVFSKTTIQSNCPKNVGWKSFYGCTAENLGGSSVELTNSFTQVLAFYTLAGVTSIIPGGLPVAGLALATSIYILVLEVYPAAIKFKNDLRAFLYANWVPVQATLETIVEGFPTNSDTSLDMKPKFRTINSEDSNISNETGFFVSSFNTLTESWNKLSNLFGILPSFQNSTEIFPFKEQDQIIISEISNPNVELVSQNGQMVKFKSISGKDEDFTYKLEVIKEGFSQVSLLIGTVYGGIVGSWNISSNDVLTCDVVDEFNFKNTTIYFHPNGILTWNGYITGTYTLSDNNIVYFEFSGTSNSQITCNNQTMFSDISRQGVFNGTYDGTYITGNITYITGANPNLNICPLSGDKSCNGTITLFK